MRISTQAASQSALMDLMQAQRESFQAREQLATGRRAPDLKGYANSAETLMTARAAQTRASAFIDANQRLESRLQVQDLAYNEMAEAATELRETLTTTNGTAMMSSVEAAFDRVLSALSTKFNGSFVFGGVRTDTQPLNANSLADLQAAVPDTTALFENAPRRQTAQLDSETTIDVNRTASEVAGDLIAVFERIADFNASADGPFDGPMDTAQQAFVTAEIANVITAFDTINDAMAENGARQARVESAITGHQTRSDYLELMIADIEDADMAEAASRLTQAQTAVEVSARTFATLSQVSLLNYL